MYDGAGKPEIFEFGAYVLSTNRRTLLCAGKRVDLTPRVFDLLVRLLENAGEPVSKEELLNSVWRGANVEEGNVNRTISTLRRKLGPQPDGNDYIATIPRHGYSFVAIVTKRREGYRLDPELPPVVADRSSRWIRKRLTTASLISLAVVGLVSAGYFVFRQSGRGVSPPKNVLLRLTEHESAERAPVFTNNGKIRFIRFIGNEAFSFLMNGDGSNVERDRSIAGLQTGKWSPDERKVFYMKESDKENTFLANADGSNEVRLPFRPGNAVWSSDSKNIIYQEGIETDNDSKQSDIFIFSLDTGKVTPVVQSPAFDADPSFSPDGKSILFVSDRDGNFEIYSQELTSGVVRRLTDSPAHDSFPTFSPDGTQILFNSDREKENIDVYLMNADGSGLRKLTDLPSADGAATNAWSPDGTKILILSDQSGSDNIYQMYVEPFEPKPVERTAPNAGHPVFSPNGDQIAFFHRSSADGGMIRILERKTGNVRDVIEVASSDTSPAFSPDGKLLFYTDFENGNTDVFSVNLDGTAKSNLTSHPAADILPAISPDGRLIAFATNRGGDLQRFEIYTMNADGTDQKAAFRDSGSSLAPSWDSTSRRIVFSNDRIGGRNGNFELFAIDADGGNVERLTYRPKYEMAGVYSPTGDRIAFTSNSDGNFEIYVMNANGTGLLRITRDAADDIDPKWSPDGKRLVFASDRGGAFRIYEVEV